MVPGVQAYVLDGFDTTAQTVEAMKAKGNATFPIYPICYVSGGTYEVWTADAGEFLNADLGDRNEEMGGQTLINIRSKHVRTIMGRRIDMCRDKGFVGVLFDDLDAFNASGAAARDLTAEDQIAYNMWLANATHGLGMAAGLQNNVGQIEGLSPFFDFVVNEQCHVTNECFKYSSVLKDGKPVWNVEFIPNVFLDACSNDTAAPSGIKTVHKKVKLDECRHDCDNLTQVYCAEEQTPGLVVAGEALGLPQPPLLLSGCLAALLALLAMGPPAGGALWSW